MDAQKIKELNKRSLRAERHRAGLTQERVATLFGIAPSTVQRWEKTASIKFSDAIRLADLYGISLDQLAGRHFNAKWGDSHVNSTSED
ncbi:helix-turn-helix domain-containing protein [Olsenella uli]|uniref:helix-turn-helix domain-containing protein n=1 Tax=Olsenella uli TaxID=133926 RepID=UPI003C6EA176